MGYGEDTEQTEVSGRSDGLLRSVSTMCPEASANTGFTSTCVYYGTVHTLISPKATEELIELKKTKKRLSRPYLSLMA